jgi:hypothetical protein
MPVQTTGRARDNRSVVSRARTLVTVMAEYCIALSASDLEKVEWLIVTLLVGPNKTMHVS